MSSTIETVTVMFVDVVGSTALRERVGEDEAERLRRAHDEIVDDAVVEHGGSIVKHLGDGAMATFGSAAGALDAAVVIQQRIDRFHRSDAGERMPIRIGLSAGDVTLDDGDCFGIPVVEAQRLEASADPSTIRCASLVHHLGRGRGSHEVRELGALDLRGLSTPLEAYEVSWSPLESGDGEVDQPLPPALASAGAAPFAGRGDALAELLELVKGCSEGGFAAVLVGGEPGVGKTRLLHELARRVIAQAGQVAAGRCDEDVQAPFQAFGGVLDWCVDHLIDGEVGLLGEHPGELVRLSPGVGVRLGGLPAPLVAEPEVERYRLMQAVESWLGAMGAQDTLLVVLDDVHWADRATLVLLQHLVRAAPSGVLLAATYRDTEVDRTHELSSALAELRRLPHVHRIELEGLRVDELCELLERAAGHELDATGMAFAEFLARETAGNPFFVGELLRHYVEDGLISRDDGRWTGDLEAGIDSVPAGVRDVVDRRVQRLGEPVEEVLRAASVIGYEFDVDLLAAVLDRQVDDVIDALDLGTDAHLLAELRAGRYRFAHALVRETLHDELSSTRRARAHRRVALAIEALHADELDPIVTDLATHWREAGSSGDPARAVDTAVRAGEQAMSASAPDTAVGWFRDALEILDGRPDPDRRRPAVLVRLADAQLRSGDPSHRETSAEAASLAIAAEDAEVTVAALTLQWRSAFSADVGEADEAKVEMLRTALEHLELDDVQRADLTGELAVELIFTRDVEGRRQALADFHRLVEALPLEERARLVSASVGRMSADLSSDLALYREASDWMLAHGDRRPPNTIAAISPFMRGGDRAAFDRVAERLTALEADDPFMRAQSVNWRVNMLVGEGDLRGAENTVQELLELAEQLELPDRGAVQATSDFAFARERGDYSAFPAMPESMLDVLDPSSAITAVTAFILLQRHDDMGARRLLQRFELDLVTDDHGYHVAIAMIAEVTAQIGTPPQCRKMLEVLLPGAGRHLGTGGLNLGPVNRLIALVLARIGDHEGAEHHFRLAIDDAHSMRLATWVVRTNLDLAEFYLASARRDDAASALADAREAIAGLDLPANAARLSSLAERIEGRT